jgi:hypothetical protein
MLPFTAMCQDLPKVPETNSAKHQRRFFEITATEGYTIHQNKGAEKMFSGRVLYPISESGVDFKTQIKIGFNPISRLSFGFIGSRMNLKYNLVDNEKVYNARPLWQYGVFADYNHKLTKRIFLFIGGSYSKYKKEYGDNMMPQASGSNESKLFYSLAFNAGLKYKIIEGLYGVAVVEYATMNITEYISYNLGVSYKF